jgi:hypothetical protein
MCTNLMQHASVPVIMVIVQLDELHLYAERCSYLWRTPCSVIHDTCTSLDVWQIDLVWLIWTTLEIYLIVLLDTQSCAPPDCEHPLTKVVHVFLV